MVEHTCYGCDNHPCPVYAKAVEDAWDETDIYLVQHSCKVGCPMGFDKDEPCYPLKETDKDCQSCHWYQQRGGQFQCVHELGECNGDRFEHEEP